MVIGRRQYRSLSDFIDGVVAYVVTQSDSVMVV